MSKENLPPVVSPYSQGNYDNSVSGDEFDIIRYLRILSMHRWKFISILLLTVLLSLIYALKQADFYRSSFDIYYTESAQRFVAEESDVPVIKSDFDKHYWLRVMQSKEIIRQTVENSGLPLSESQARSNISVSLETGRDLTSPIYRITITASEAYQIPVLLNSFVKSLNDMLVDQQVEFSGNLVKYLSQQLAENFEQLSQFDREILTNQADNPYLVRDMNLLANNLESFRTARQNAMIELASLQASRQRTQEELEQLDPTIFNELAYSEPLKVQLMNLQVDLARALTRNQEDHPKVKALRDNIVHINNMIRDSLEQTTEIRSISQNPLEKQLMSKLLDFHISEISAETRINSLEKVISEIEAQMLPDTTYINQKRLVRNRERVLMTIDKLNSKLIDVQSATHGGLYSFIFIDEATAPEAPANKSLAFFLLIGIVAGLGLGAGTVYLYDLIDNRIMLFDDFEKLYKLPVFGYLPHNKSISETLPLISNNSQVHKFKQEAAEIIFNVKHHLNFYNKKTICVCSPMRSEGKTFVSLQLAFGLAEKNMKVLLVDMDVMAPRLSGLLKRGCIPGSELIDEESLINNLKNKFSLTDYLKGDITPEKAIVSTSNPNLHFLATEAGNNDFASTPYNFDNVRVKELVEWASSNYDAVVFDTPAMLFFPDLAAFAGKTDLVIPVVRLRHSTRGLFEKMLRLLNTQQEKIAGTIVNDVVKVPFGKYDDTYNYKNYYSYRAEKKPKNWFNASWVKEKA